ncbi:alkane 1-monooxygenase [Prescottella defluvii]|nr:alkane 1-monooxygenase [Prescottella defluvii]
MSPVSASTPRTSWAQEGEPRALDVEDRSGPIVLRALLHRAQSWSSRARRDTRGPCEFALRRKFLDVPAAQRVGSLRSAWRLEKARLERLDKGPWTIHNDVLNAWLMSVALFVVLIAVFGWQVVPYLVLQAVFGFALLEAVNYLEHYGLLRQHTASGRYERCTPAHSWNSDHLTTNIFLYHLQRHSDHHANPTRRYQTLRSMDTAPQLPAGYAAMIVLAYVPPLWRSVMDKRVLAHYDGDITKVNLQPGKREKLIAAYGTGGGAA